MQKLKAIAIAIGSTIIFIVGIILGRRSFIERGSGRTGSNINGPRPGDPGPGQAHSDLGNNLDEGTSQLGDIKAGNERSGALLRRARSILERAKKKNGG